MEEGGVNGAERDNTLHNNNKNAFSDMDFTFTQDVDNNRKSTFDADLSTDTTSFWTSSSDYVDTSLKPSSEQYFNSSNHHSFYADDTNGQESVVRHNTHTFEDDFSDTFVDGNRQDYDDDGGGTGGGGGDDAGVVYEFSGNSYESGYDFEDDGSSYNVVDSSLAGMYGYSNFRTLDEIPEEVSKLMMHIYTGVLVASWWCLSVCSSVRPSEPQCVYHSLPDHHS